MRLGLLKFHSKSLHLAFLTFSALDCEIYYQMKVGEKGVPPWSTLLLRDRVTHLARPPPPPHVTNGAPIVFFLEPSGSEV